LAAQDSIHYSDTKGRNLFAIRISDESMAPIFVTGDYAIINPNVTTAAGALVAVRILIEAHEEKMKREKLIVRLLEEGPEGLWARPLDERWNHINVSLATSAKSYSRESMIGEVIGRVVERKRIYA